MLSRKRTTMAELEPGAKREYNIDPSPKVSKHFDENGNVNNFVQQFSKEKDRKEEPPKKKPQNSGAFYWILKNSDVKVKDQQLIEMEVDNEHIDRSQTFSHINSFKKELATSQGQINYYMQYQSNDKQKQFDLKMDESSN
uniref:Uncharacterized protein n=1 Tax=Panagrolaimus sp. PS1159 TaxID=55785 RepID=A0AC35GV61_9BILA